MDASAYIDTDKWERMKNVNGWNEIEMRDNRYNQIVHMVSAANGAEEFYSTEVGSILHIICISYFKLINIIKILFCIGSFMSFGRRRFGT